MLPSTKYLSPSSGTCYSQLCSLWVQTSGRQLFDFVGARGHTAELRSWGDRGGNVLHWCSTFWCSPSPLQQGSDGGGQEVTGGPPAVDQLHRGAFKTRTGSETQKGSQSQGEVGGKWRGTGLNLPAWGCSAERLVKLRHRRRSHFQIS